MRHHGIIKFYNKDKGYGFIKHKNDQSLYLHVSEILGLVVFPLVEKVVSYEVADDSKGLKAINIQLLEYMESNQVLVNSYDLFNKRSLNDLSRDKISLTEFIEKEFLENNPMIVHFTSKLPNEKIDSILKNSSLIKKYLYDHAQELSTSNIFTNTYLFDKVMRDFVSCSKERSLNIVGPGGSGKTEILYSMLSNNAILITLSNGEKIRGDDNRNQRILTLTQLLLKSNEIVQFDNLYYTAMNLFKDLRVSFTEGKEIISQLIPYLDSEIIKKLVVVYESYQQRGAIKQLELDYVSGVLSTIKVKKHFTEESELNKIKEYAGKYSIDENDKEQLYIKMLENRVVTYNSLVYLFINNKLTLNFIDNTTLLIDDINTFGLSDWKIINKLIELTPNHVFAYDDFFMAYQFTRNTRPFDEYREKYKPMTVRISENLRSSKAIVDRMSQLIESVWGFSNQVFSLSSDSIFIEKKVSFFGWLQNIKKTKVCVVLRKNQDLDNLEFYLKKYGLSYTRLDRNFFDTKEGEKYIYLFKFILAKTHSTGFTERIKNDFLNNFNFNLKTLLDFHTSHFDKNSVISNVIDGQYLIYVLEYLINETGKSSTKEALQEFLDNQHLYPYYRTHYYNNIYKQDVNIYLSTFHRLKQVKEFDYVVFPLTTSLENSVDERSLSYTALSKSKKGYGLFDFQIENLDYISRLVSNKHYIGFMSENNYTNITLYDRNEKKDINDTIISSMIEAYDVDLPF